ncbi:fibrinogen-like YCDxxxxGGGW domain-containing protein [Enhygromyxa salina]|nr:fibrinogen-like YCDxxxxGGGW domain-containing protein [Enhygromyxa salina]
MLAVCGDGLLHIGHEACDDGNATNDDTCTTLCEAPGCSDGLVSGMESDVDCGGGCLPCGVGLNCNASSDCETWGCFEGVCGYTESCEEINSNTPEAPSGRYWIDVDGDGPNTPFEVLCELERGGGGWTLVLVSSDDAQHTWTWEHRAWLTTDATVVGSLDETNRDYKSRAYNEMVFRDILAVHAPSDIWAQYDDVTQGSTDLGHYVGAEPSPNCDYAMAGNGIEMTDGTLASNLENDVGLCDTDLYFNIGDHETSLDYCLVSDVCSTATHGLAWNRGGNNGCPFDDADLAGLGPASQCGCCELGRDMLESGGRGFAGALGLNSGTAELGENYIQVFVR